MPQPDLGAFGRLRGFADYDREAQEFNMRKQQAALQKEQMAMAQQLGAQKLEMGALELEKARNPGMQMPFDMGFDDQMIANEAYRFNVSKGMDHDTAKRAAIDMVLGSKQDMDVHPVTGEVRMAPRRGIFGGGVAPVGGHGTQPQDPIQAHKQATIRRQEETGMVNQMQRPDLLPGAQQQAQPLNMYSAVKIGAGPLAMGRETIGAVGGAVAPGLVDEPTVQARNMMRGYERDFAKMKVLSGRPSVWEQVKLGALTPSVGALGGGLLENEASATAKLKQQHEQAIEDMNNYVAMSRDMRLTDTQNQDALQKAIEVQQFINRYFGGMDIPQGQAPAGIGAGDVRQLIDKTRQTISGQQQGGFKYLGTE